jgi:hypothetical protein
VAFGNKTYETNVKTSTTNTTITLRIWLADHLAGGYKKKLTMLHKQTPLDICQQYLDRYGEERDSFLESNITDENSTNFVRKVCVK